jgi:hypothetical protein
MRKTIASILAGVFVFVFISAAADVELDNKLLVGVNYVRIQCRFNGVPYYQGYKGIQTRDLEEYNADEAEAALKEAKIPISKKSFRDMYDRLESLLKKAGFRILEVRQGESDSTIIPTLSLNLDAMAITPARGKESYVVLVYVTVSRWLSTWIGTDDIQSRVIVWWKKKMVIAGPGELNKSIDAAVGELMEDFLARWKEANETTPGDVKQQQ